MSSVPTSVIAIFRHQSSGLLEHYHASPFPVGCLRGRCAGLQHNPFHRAPAALRASLSEQSAMSRVQDTCCEQAFSHFTTDAQSLPGPRATIQNHPSWAETSATPEKNKLKPIMAKRKARPGRGLWGRTARCNLRNSTCVTGVQNRGSNFCSAGSRSFTSKRNSQY